MWNENKEPKVSLIAKLIVQNEKHALHNIFREKILQMLGLTTFADEFYEIAKAHVGDDKKTIQSHNYKNEFDLPNGALKTRIYQTLLDERKTYEILETAYINGWYTESLLNEEVKKECQINNVLAIDLIGELNIQFRDYFLATLLGKEGNEKIGIWLDEGQKLRDLIPAVIYRFQWKKGKTGIDESAIPSWKIALKKETDPLAEEEYLIDQMKKKVILRHNVFSRYLLKNYKLQKNGELHFKNATEAFTEQGEWIKNEIQEMVLAYSLLFPFTGVNHLELSKGVNFNTINNEEHGIFFSNDVELVVTLDFWKVVKNENPQEENKTYQVKKTFTYEFKVIEEDIIN